MTSERSVKVSAEGWIHVRQEQATLHKLTRAEATALRDALNNLLADWPAVEKRRGEGVR